MARVASVDLVVVGDTEMRADLQKVNSEEGPRHGSVIAVAQRIAESVFAQYVAGVFARLVVDDLLRVDLRLGCFGRDSLGDDGEAVGAAGFAPQPCHAQFSADAALLLSGYHWLGGWFGVVVTDVFWGGHA